jgi:hypothetical protein
MLRQYSNARLQHRLGDAALEVADHVAHQPLALGLIHHVTDQGAAWP